MGLGAGSGLGCISAHPSIWEPGFSIHSLGMRAPLFNHDQLQAYQLAREAVREIEKVIALLPRGCADAIDQLRRASLSVCLNLAEGCGEFAPAEKARFYRMAKRSAGECAAVLDNLVDRGLLPEQAALPALVLYSRTTGALVNLIQSVDRRTKR